MPAHQPDNGEVSFYLKLVIPLLIAMDHVDSLNQLADVAHKSSFVNLHRKDPKIKLHVCIMHGPAAGERQDHVNRDDQQLHGGSACRRTWSHQPDYRGA